MGMMHHHAVIATTWDRAKFGALVAWIDGLPPEVAQRFARSAVPAINSYQTIVLLPDGSKEGWPDSDAGDRLRESFIARLKADDYGDGSSPWDYVEVGFGELGASVESTNCA